MQPGVFSESICRTAVLVNEAERFYACYACGEPDGFFENLPQGDLLSACLPRKEHDAQRGGFIALSVSGQTTAARRGESSDAFSGSFSGTSSRTWSVSMPSAWASKLRMTRWR